MKYKRIIHGKFIERPNRFIAYVELTEDTTDSSDMKGDIVTVHVKNTGRCKELLLPGVEVILDISDNPERKTRYDLVMVKKNTVGWVNIDSQSPNKIALEWLQSQGYDYIKPEYKYGNSRIDFYMEKGNEKFLLEIKGCTLEIDGQGFFPDAPTERGAKHLRELTGAISQGYHCMLGYVIQINGINSVEPYSVVDPDYGEAFEVAVAAGVEILYILCCVKEDEVVVADSRVRSTVKVD